MPNKRKLAKIRLKLLASGKLNTNKNVKDTLKQLESKAQIDNEDINFNYEKDGSKNFEKIEDGERNNRKTQRMNMAKPFGYVRKRKESSSEMGNKIKKQKVENEPKVVKTELDTYLPRKSKKNKYFLLAHPEIIKEKEESKNSSDVIDINKLKKMKAKSDKQTSSENKNKKGESKSTKKSLKTKSNNIWLIDECNSSDDEQIVSNSTDQASRSFDLSNIEKSFKIKETFEKMDDGTIIKVFKPEFVENESAESEDETEEKKTKTKKKVVKEDETQKVTVASKNPLMEKLQSSRFRYLNEIFYTQTSDKSFEYFQKDEEAFKAYHEGFRTQALKWPINPLDEIVKYIKSRSSNLVVADFGCGEAKLAQQVPNKVHSFDFVSLNDLVTKCDMKNVPLNPQSCDIAVFCLSLMGTNVIDFLCEAHRVLKTKGLMKVAEVVSRIEDKAQFIHDIEAIGFKIVSESKNKDLNKPDYFYLFDFIKISPSIKSKPSIKLAACLYKKR